jgi:hypothetical protein
VRKGPFDAAAFAGFVLPGQARQFPSKAMLAGVLAIADWQPG